MKEWNARHSMIRGTYSYFFILLVCFFVFMPVEASSKQSYRIAVLPEYLEIIIYNQWNPIVEYLQEKLDKKFSLVIPRTFKKHMEMIKSGKVDFSYQNPYVLLKLLSKCTPLTISEKGKKWGIESRGVIVTKSGNGIKSVDDLVGKTVGVVSYLSTEGYMAQKNLLDGMMIDVKTDLKLVEAVEGLHEDVIIDVMEKKADAGFVSEEVLKRKGPIGSFSVNDLRALKIVATTNYVPNWIFSSTKSVDPGFAKRVQETLLKTPLNHKVLKTADIRRFVPIPSNYLEEFRARMEWK